MKFDKEYPATHSMETAWYAADEDGNVALIMYNDNGPVPENLPDVRIGELAFGYYDGKDCKFVKLTEEQVEELSGPTLPLGEDGTLYDPDTFVKVEKKNREAFETAMKNARYFCRLVEPEWGLYAVEKYILFLSSIQMRHIQVMASLSLLRISYQIRTMFMRNLIGLMIHCRE
jgi:hypothetical protein